MKAYAQIINPIAPEGLSFGGIISGIVGLAIILGFIASFFFLISGALQWITSGGAPEQVEGARNRILHAVIGLVLVVSAWAIFTLIGDFFNIDFTNLPIPVLGE
jgi:hypothetical protein